MDLTSLLVAAAVFTAPSLGFNKVAPGFSVDARWSAPHTTEVRLYGETSTLHKVYKAQGIGVTYGSRLELVAFKGPVELLGGLVYHGYTNASWGKHAVQAVLGVGWRRKGGELGVRWYLPEHNTENLASEVNMEAQSRLTPRVSINAGVSVNRFWNRPREAERVTGVSGFASVGFYLKAPPR
jgi:hypothetical protein